MDDQGAGGSSRRDDTDLAWGPRRESSLPLTLRPHLYHGPRHTSFPGIAPLVVPNLPHRPDRPLSQGLGRSLPSPSSLLRETEFTFDHDSVILSRSLDTSPINPPFVANPDLPLPRFVVHGPPQPPRPPTPQSRPSPWDQDFAMRDVWELSQPQPHQLGLPQFLSDASYQGGVGVPSRLKSASPSRSRTASSFAGDLYNEGQSEIKPLYQAGSMWEPPAIEPREAVPERKGTHRWPGVRKELGFSTAGGASTNPSSGATNPTRKKPSTKVPVACDFCRKRKLKCDGGRPCSSCSARSFECAYQPGGPRRRGPGRAPKKTRAEASRLRQQQRQQQQRRNRQHLHPDQGQMSISGGSPGPAGPSLMAIVPSAGLMRAGSPLTPGDAHRLPSQSPGASTSEMETGVQAGRKRRLSESSVEEPERKRSRIREF